VYGCEIYGGVLMAKLNAVIGEQWTRTEVSALHGTLYSYSELVTVIHVTAERILFSDGGFRWRDGANASPWVRYERAGNE